MHDGRVRDLPLPLPIQQLLTPVVIHMLLRPAMPRIPGIELPDIDTSCDTFTDNFVRAVAHPSLN